MNRGRWHAVLGISLIAQLALIIPIGALIYAFPPTSRPAKSDAILVLGPPTHTRLAIAEELLSDGYSDNLMISVPWKSEWTSEVTALCEGPATYHVFCKRPDPFTTQGEARWAGVLAQEHGWKSLTVVTFTPHVLRASIVIGRCFSGRVAMVPDRSSLSPGEWIYQFAYQSGAFVKVVLNPWC